MKVFTDKFNMKKTLTFVGASVFGTLTLLLAMCDCNIWLILVSEIISANLIIKAVE